MRALNRLVFGAAVLAGTLPAMAASTMYCCQDAQGRKACGDILPAACQGRAYQVLGAGGKLIRQVEAPMTPEQQAQKAAEARRQKEAEEAARERQRLDQALLHTYGSPEDIDAVRERAEAESQTAVKTARDRIAELGKARKKLEAEAEFYRKKPMPPGLNKSMKENEAEIQAQNALIEQKTREAETIRARYEEEKRRYIELRKSPPRPQ